jgi:hypothetical protein
MKNLLIGLTVVGISSTLAMGDELQDRIESSRDSVDQLAKALKTELEAAIKAGGARAAIAVCKQRASAITDQESVRAGFNIMRTSLKVRSTENVPDSWQRMVLQQFQQRADAGEDPKTMEYHEIVRSKGREIYRYMKAIPTDEVCLICHGDKISPEITTFLNATYPDDQARGFKLGELRGAFSVSQDM